jgi:hypothetical protein
MTGYVQSVLTRDCQTVRFVLADRASVMLLTALCLLYGLGIGLYSCYALSLVILGCLPFTFVSIYIAAQEGTKKNHSFVILTASRIVCN